MLNKMKILLAGLAIVATAGAAVAAGPGYGFARNANCPVYNQVNRTPEQRARWNDVRENRRRNAAAPGPRIGFRDGGGYAGGYNRGWQVPCYGGPGRGMAPGPRF